MYGGNTVKLLNHGLLGCSPGSIGRYVLLPGDPGRVPMIAELFEDAEEVSRSREFCAYTGTLRGEKISAVSTGMGGPSTAITVQELAHLGAEVMIRVGTSGAMQKFMEATDLVITWGAVRDEYTSQQFLPLSYPAVADLDVTLALCEAATELGYRHHIGISQSKDAFYAEHQPERMPARHKLEQNWFAWRKAGVLCSEMEASVLFILAHMLGVKAGGIMVAGPSLQSLQNLLKTAVRAIEILIDRERGGAQ
ncbi:MAG: nucleoside phosphorylase [Firmicutes bacterium]|nr:nucleoside phosphorylase [Bacillota bacterium]